MKKYIDILTEIKRTRASISDTAKNEKELEKLALKMAIKNGTEEEQNAAKLKYKEAEARYIKELEKNETAKLKIEILKTNAARALFSENIKIICDIWNKYEGKPHGEKTANKIKEELKTATGYYISIGNQYGDARIRLYFSYNDRCPLRDLEFHPIWNGERQPALTCDNKIIRLSPDNFTLYCIGEYVENINAHITSLRKAHKAAQDAQNAFETAVDTYNKLTRGNIEAASTREGVKNWMII